jgi:hypothetical protein
MTTWQQRSANWERRAAAVEYGWLELPNTSPMATTHDFGDGRPVPAARHKNPDGSLGGWVARSAYVDPRATLDAAAVVFGSARVFGASEVRGRASVRDNAQVREGSFLSGECSVRGDAIVTESTVLGHARVDDHAFVAGRSSSVATPT